jgi:DNA-binding response OmpR family regulator
MENHPDSRPWMPKPFTVAVLDSDEHLADALCNVLRDSGFAPAAFYDITSLVQVNQGSRFDAYVLDYLADWQPESHALEDLVTSIRTDDKSDAPIFILGNQIEPERVERLSRILMQYEVRYLLKPLRMAYLAKRIGEAIAKRAGL